MALLAHLEIRGAQGNRRYAPRRALKIGSYLHGPGTDAVVHDISVTGLLIEVSTGLAAGDTLDVEIPGFGPAPATVIWNSGEFFGCRFHEPITPGTISAALLRNPIDRSVSLPTEVSLAAQRTGLLPDQVADSAKLSLKAKYALALSLGLVAWCLLISLLVWIF